MVIEIVAEVVTDVDAVLLTVVEADDVADVVPDDVMLVVADVDPVVEIELVTVDVCVVCSQSRNSPAR